MQQRKENKATKEYLYTYCAGGFYPFNVCRITDAAHHVYYVGERINYGGTVIADTEEEVKQKLEAEVPLINDFWSKIR